MNQASNATIIEILSKQEAAIASLYDAFANALPEMNTFWRALSLQEKAHDHVLKEMAKLCEPGKVWLSEHKFNKTAIQTTIESITKRTNETEASGITPIRALAIAADIEHSLIESDYFQVIESKLTSVQKEIDEIRIHTEQHIRTVDKQLAKLRAERENEEAQNGS